MANDLNGEADVPPGGVSDLPGWQLWTLVFGINLGIPLSLGLIVTSDGGWAGMLLATLLCWTVGLVVCSRPGRLGPVLIRGGSLVAATQCLPLLQLLAGSLAIYTCEGLSGGSVGRNPGVEAELYGFAATLMTATPLLFAAFVLGGGHRLLFSSDSTEDESDGEPPPDDARPAGHDA